MCSFLRPQVRWGAWHVGIYQNVSSTLELFQGAKEGIQGSSATSQWTYPILSAAMTSDSSEGQKDFLSAYVY